MTAFTSRYTADEATIETDVCIDLGDDIETKIMPTHSKQVRSVFANLNVTTRRPAKATSVGAG